MSGTGDEVDVGSALKEITEMLAKYQIDTAQSFDKGFTQMADISTKLDQQIAQVRGEVKAVQDEARSAIQALTAKLDRFMAERDALSGTASTAASASDGSRTPPNNGNNSGRNVRARVSQFNGMARSSSVPLVTFGDADPNDGNQRGLFGEVNNNGYRFRTVRVHAFKEEDNVSTADRLAFGKEVKDRLQEWCTNTHVIKEVKAWSESKTDVSFLFNSRAEAWAFLDDIAQKEKGDVNHKGQTLHFAMTKVGSAKARDMMMNKAVRALREMKGETPGSTSIYKAIFKQLFSLNVVGTGACSLGKIVIEDDIPVLKTHTNNCNTHHIDPAEWKAKLAALMAETSDSLEGYE